MRSTLCALLLLLLAAGCAADGIVLPGDGERYTKLITRPNGFHFIAAVDTRFPEDDEDAERVRLAWLDRFVGRADVCPDGYALTERRPDRGKTPINGSLDHIYYTGVCR